MYVENKALFPFTKISLGDFKNIFHVKDLEDLLFVSNLLTIGE
jgi:hypothetical protein